MNKKKKKEKKRVAIKFQAEIDFFACVYSLYNNFDCPRLPTPLFTKNNIMKNMT